MPRKRIVGKVISDKMDKTITVEKNDLIKHPVYKKYIKKRSKYHAHDENNEAKVGDIVEIEESRPYSKSKAFVLLRIVKTNEFEDISETPEDVEAVAGGEEAWYK